jgi:hypothetical protein
VTALRCLIDSMIFDAIAAEPEMLALVDRATSARRLLLLAAVTSIEQVAATPDAAHRRRLQRVRVLVVPPAGEAPGAAALIAALARQPGVGWDDALIAAQSAPLVTEDRALREAAGALLPRLEVWGWADGLRPRLEALAQD